MHFRVSSSYASVISIMLLCCVGCRLGPKYYGPEEQPPEQWKNEESAPQNDSTEAAPCFEGPWWHVFNDPILDDLEAQALAANPHLYAALDRVAQARSLAGVSRSALYPNVALTPSYTTTGTLFKIYLPPGGFPNGGILQNSYRVHELLYSMPFTMNYEIDLWGKLAGQYDSARYYAQVQMENFRSAMLTLTADVAAAYFQLRALDAQIAILAEDIQLLRGNVTLVDGRYSKGLVGYGDVAGAQQQLALTEATHFDAMRQRAVQEDAIATLINVEASLFCLESHPLKEPPPKIPPGLPSDVLHQRPDIAAAEREMASEQAMIGVAYASFFPSLELTGTLGYFSPQLNDFMRWKSRLWLLAANSAQTIFDAGKNQANLDLTYARFNEASNEYRQTVLKAFQEVEDALINIRMQKEAYDSYNRAASASGIRLGFSRRRYTEGLVGYLEVIDSERTKIQTDLNVVGALDARYAATIQLIKALGGSWPLPCEMQE